MELFDFCAPLKNSALSLVLGDCLGKGASRCVYDIVHDDSLVMKIEYAARTFHNQMEWLIWQEVKDWPISDWFVPCVSICSYGNALVQKKAEGFTSEKDFMQAVQRTRGGVIPEIFDDIHYANFGLYNGVVACFDYGYHHIFSMMARSLSIEAGYIIMDPPVTETDFTHDGQLSLNL